MPKEKETTNKRTEALNRRKRPKQNTLGMDEEEYEKYKEKMVNRYRDEFESTIRGLAREQREEGITLYADRLRRWIGSAGVRIKSKGQSIRKGKERMKQTTINLTADQLDTLSQFPNSSEIARVAMDIVLGIPTQSMVLFLGEGKNVIFVITGKIIEAYITSDLTQFEERTVQTLINKAKLHGPHYIINFATENELDFYGGQNLYE